MERRFQLLDEKLRRKMIRIALHPRDPHSAVKAQLEIICILKEQGYTITLYQELIEKLRVSRIYLRLVIVL